MLLDSTRKVIKGLSVPIEWRWYDQGFNNKYFEDVIRETGLFSDRLLIRFLNRDLTLDGVKFQQAWTVSRQLLKYARHPKLLLSNLWSEEWDCCVLVAKVMKDRYEKHRSYFTLFLSHELGHVKLLQENPDLHVYCEYVGCFLSDKDEIHDFEQPLEKYLENFGLYVSRKLFNEPQLVKEIKACETNITKRRKFLLDIVYAPVIKSASEILDEVNKKISSRENEFLQWLNDTKNDKKKNKYGFFDHVKPRDYMD